MKKSCFNIGLALAMATMLNASRPALAQQPSSSAASAIHTVITVEAHHGTNIPVINTGDVMVYEGHDRDQVTDMVPLVGDHAGLELFLLIDDAANSSLDSQLQDLRQFINSQSATTAIGVGYMRDGTVQIVQNLTTDHAQAAKSLRLPLGDPGASPSPYFSIVDLVKRWPEAPVRREILMISDGVDRFYGSGPDDPYVESAVEAVQKAGITIYSIYAPGVGHFGHSFWRINWGQNYLSQISDQTGGEMYNYMFGSAVSFVPFLDDLSHRLTHQFLVTFIPKPEKKPGMRQVRFRTEVPNAELVGPDRVYVP
ncbi:MAG TPA: hypothetical protein VGV15_08790 [Terriglobales bacterium]|nr:hypothetical protein [Terriglobales bacterium]